MLFTPSSTSLKDPTSGIRASLLIIGLTSSRVIHNAKSNNEQEVKQEVEEEKKETIDMKKSLALKMSSDQEKKLVNHVVRMRKMK